MKKNKMMRIASVLLVAVLLSTCAISGTFAKYTTSSTTESDSARVAKWDIDFAGNDVDSKTFVFNLFNTVYDTNTTSNETDVKTGETETIIAPGTYGSFDIVLANLSEVTAQYSIDFTVTNESNIPVEFKVGSGDWGALADITASDATQLAMETGTATITVEWRWVFENGADAGDTALGSAATAATITVAAQVTVEQVD